MKVFKIILTRLLDLYSFYVKKAHIGVVPGIEEFVKAFTSKKAMGPRGYLAEIGLVPLAKDKYKAIRTAALKLETISIK